MNANNPNCVQLSENETIALSTELRRLWPAEGEYPFWPSPSLSDAFLVADRIRELLIENPPIDTGMNTLMLCQGGYRNWLATFDGRASDYPKWHEKIDLLSFKYAARAETPQLAIARAAVLCVPELVQFVENNDKTTKENNDSPAA